MKQCELCKELGVDVADNQHEELEVGAGYGDKWMCDDCADAAHEEQLAQTPF